MVLKIFFLRDFSSAAPTYTKSEVVNIMSKVPVGGVHSRAATMKVILVHQKKYSVPCSQATIYRLMTNHAKGLIILGEFKGGGRPPICSDTDLKRNAESLDEAVGKTYDQSDVKTMIKKCKLRNSRKLVIKIPLNKSADEGSVAIFQSYISKSNTHYADENSILGSTATLGVVVATHFIPVEEENADICAEVKSLPSATRKLYNMATDIIDAAVYPVEPYLLYSTDDTTEYIFEGTQNKFVHYVLATKSSIAKRGTNAVYKCGDNKSMSGMRVKLTFTFSAMGACFSLVCTVSGLTEREMPMGEEFIHIRVPGLCIGGGGVNINNQEVGHLLFMRNIDGAEKKRY
jgi:hypothetical protein